MNYIRYHSSLYPIKTAKWIQFQLIDTTYEPIYYHFTNNLWPLIAPLIAMATKQEVVQLKSKHTYINLNYGHRLCETMIPVYPKNKPSSCFVVCHIPNKKAQLQVWTTSSFHMPTASQNIFDPQKLSLQTIRKSSSPMFQVPIRPVPTNMPRRYHHLEIAMKK